MPSMVPGAVLDVTKLIFLPMGLKSMASHDSYVETITFNGWIADRIRLEDLSKDILKHFLALSGKWAGESQIRVQVWMKSQTKGWGSSGGSVGGAGFPGSTAVSGGVAGLVGYSTSYQDPQYVVTFYRIPYTK